MTPREVHITRYITPLREGGSLPAIVEADDGFLYVAKFWGAGQGTKSLIADFVGLEMARKLGLNAPETVFAHLDDRFGKTEPDEEIQDLLKFSQGINLGVHYLAGAITYDGLLYQVSTELATKIVWLDAYLTNVDRTAKNTNMLVWHRELWLIDFGASLYFHHNWDSAEKQSSSPFVPIKDHVLLEKAADLIAFDKEVRSVISDAFIDEVIEAVPASWLVEEADRAVYSNFLKARLKNTTPFLAEAENARKARI